MNGMDGTVNDGGVGSLVSLHRVRCRRRRSASVVKVESRKKVIVHGHGHGGWLEIEQRWHR